MKDDQTPPAGEKSGLTRRDFMKISGISAAVPLVLGTKVVHAAGEEVVVHGPGKAPVVLIVNGKKLTADLEPRVTLLEALRNNFDLTGAKNVCDRGFLRGLYRIDGGQAGLRVLRIGHRCSRQEHHDD